MSEVSFIVLTNESKITRFSLGRPPSPDEQQVSRGTTNSSRSLYSIVSIHLYSASHSAHQSEALPVRETQREESSMNAKIIEAFKD